ncbi:hypothetical protein HDU92_007536 [Lobulomyces angularis]|nr:hypothetical protein HDU92_007536 [Lobulomyces angularis]
MPSASLKQDSYLESDLLGRFNLLKKFNTHTRANITCEDYSHYLQDLPGKNIHTDTNFLNAIFEPLKGGVQEISTFDKDTLEASFMLQKGSIPGFDGTIFESLNIKEENIKKENGKNNLNSKTSISNSYTETEATSQKSSAVDSKQSNTTTKATIPKIKFSMKTLQKNTLEQDRKTENDIEVKKRKISINGIDEAPKKKKKKDKESRQEVDILN